MQTVQKPVLRVLDLFQWDLYIVSNFATGPDTDGDHLVPKVMKEGRCHTERRRKLLSIPAESVLALPCHTPMEPAERGRSGTTPERGPGVSPQGPKRPNKARRRDPSVKVAPKGIGASCPVVGGRRAALISIGMVNIASRPSVPSERYWCSYLF